VESATCQVLLQRHKQMEVRWGKVRNIGLQNYGTIASDWLTVAPFVACYPQQMLPPTEKQNAWLTKFIGQENLLIDMPHSLAWSNMLLPVFCLEGRVDFWIDTDVSEEHTVTFIPEGGIFMLLETSVFTYKFMHIYNLYVRMIYMYIYIYMYSDVTFLSFRCCYCLMNNFRRGLIECRVPSQVIFTFTSRSR
jgi:hypothetical protein